MRLGGVLLGIAGATMAAEETQPPLPSAAAPLAPYAASSRPMASALVYDESTRSQAEIFLLDTFAGFMARDAPVLYRVRGKDWRSAEQAKANSYTRWLQDMEQDGLQVNDTVLSATTQQVLKAAAAAAGLSLAKARYIRCNFSDSVSTSAAVTLAAGSNEMLLIAADEAVAAVLESGAIGAELHADLRGHTVTDVLDGYGSDPGIEDRLSKRVYVFLDPTQNPGSDMAVFARAPLMVWQSDMQAQDRVLRRDWQGKDGMGVAFGWMSSGSENDYVSALNAHGVLVHASNWCDNFAALANWQSTGLGVLPAPSDDSGLASADPPYLKRHTVSFLMSDGDNVQWMLNNFLTSEAWFSAPNRGEVPIGWTVAPAMVKLAPAFVKDILSKLTPKDELVAGPSGGGYTYPQTWPAELGDGYAELTAGMAEQLGMRVWNILGQNDEDPKPEELAPFLRARGGKANDGLLYYGYGDGYASMHGQVWLLQGKPVVGGRYSLWGNGTEGDMLGVDGMIEKLKAMPKNGSLATGYSVIPVNAWSHSYADVVEIARALEADGGFDVVLPSELLRRVRGILGASNATDAESEGIGASSGAYVATNKVEDSLFA